MNEKQDQHFDALSENKLTHEQQEQQKGFQKRIDELKKIKHETKSEIQWMEKEMVPQISLVSLEEKIQELDGRNLDEYEAAVEKIEAELKLLEATRPELSSFQRSIVTSASPPLLAQLQKEFPESSSSSVEWRVASIITIANIKPQDWESKIANFFAWVIEKLVA